jgi:hypothetical protein
MSMSMSKRASRKHEPAQAGMNLSAVILIAAVAFMAGVGGTWFFLHGKSGQTAAGEPPVFTTRQSGANGDMVEPDVSGMSAQEAAVTLGNWNYDRKNWAKAIGFYQQAVALGMGNADVRTDLGNAYRFSNEPQKALEQYRAAREQNPQHENSLFNMATLYSQVLHDPAAAMLAWREYLQRFPNGQNADTARKFLLDEAEKPAGGK